MSRPLVSVVMPVFNGERFLGQAIDSILHQDYEPIELILVNDGSTDSSKGIIETYGDSRIRYIENQKNSGIVFSRNKGLELARGQYVATLDSDDLALPDRISRQVNFLETHLDYGMCGTYYRAIDRNGKWLRNVKYPTENRDIFSHLVLLNCICNSTVLIRRELASELRYTAGYDIVEDYDLWYRVSKISKIANLPFFGSNYRVHSDNISVAKFEDMLFRLQKIEVQIFRDLNLNISETELAVHSNWLNRNIQFFKDPTLFCELEAWIGKLCRCLFQNGWYNHELQFKLIVDRWIVVAFNVNNYEKLFYNSIFEQNKSLYLSRLGKRIWSKIAGATS